MPVDAKSLHEHAVQAEKHLEALATGLGQAGAGDAVVKTVSQCADIARQVAQKLGSRGAEQKDQADDQAAAAPEEGAAPPEGQPPAAEAAPAEEPPPRRPSVRSATDELHNEVKRRAAARRGAPA